MGKVRTKKAQKFVKKFKFHVLKSYFPTHLRDGRTVELGTIIPLYSIMKRKPKSTKKKKIQKQNVFHTR